MPAAPAFPEPLDAPEEVETPGVTTIEALAELLGIDPAATSKAMPVVEDDGTLVLVLVRGDDRLVRDEALRRARRRVAAGHRRGDPRRVRRGRGVARPRGFEGRVIADETLREGQFVAGANRDGWHLRGVEAGRDYEPEFADLREPREGDVCPSAAGALQFRRRSRSATSSTSAPSTRGR